MRKQRYAKVTHRASGRVELSDPEILMGIIGIDNTLFKCLINHNKYVCFSFVAEKVIALTSAQPSLVIATPLEHQMFYPDPSQKRRIILFKFLSMV